MKKTLSIVLCLILTTTLIFSTVLPASADIGDKSFTERESNDTVSTADRIYHDYTVSGSITRYGYDLDRFKITLSSRSKVTIIAVADYSTLVLGAFDYTGETVVAAAMRHGYSDGMYRYMMTETLNGGTYYVTLFDDERRYGYSYMFYITIEPVVDHATGNHSFGTAWIDGGDGYHYHMCTTQGCTVKDEVTKQSHTGGAATCKQKAICTVCNKEYGDYAAHKGGMATTTERAICEVCKEPYGELKNTKCLHTYTSQAYYDLRKFITDNGESNGDGYYFKKDIDSHVSYSFVTEDDNIRFVMTYKYSSDHFAQVVMHIKEDNSNPNVSIMYARTGTIPMISCFYETNIPSDFTNIEQKSFNFEHTCKNQTSNWSLTHLSTERSESECKSLLNSLFQLAISTWNLALLGETVGLIISLEDFTPLTVEEHTGGTATATERAKCEICGMYYGELLKSYTVGDLDKNDSITDADAVFLLMHTFFPEDYEVNQPVDFNDDGSVTDADAVYLLMFTFFPEDYPIS